MAGLLDDPNGMSGLLGNPLFNIGLGILAANKPGASFGGALGQGGLLGIQNMRAAQQAQAINQYRQMQIADLKRQQDARTKLAGALETASQPQTIPGFGGAELTAFSNQYDPGVMAMPGSLPAPRSAISGIAGQLSQPQTVTPSQTDIMRNPGVRSALLELDPKSALTMMTKEAEAPKTVTAYDANGREVTMQWDPMKRAYAPLGGSKTDVLSPAAEGQKIRIAEAGRTSITNNVGPTGIDYGKPPENMVWARDANGKIVLQPDPATGFSRPVAVPIGGGPMEQKLGDKAKTEAERTKQQGVTADIVTQDIGRVLSTVNDASFPVTGFGSMLSGVPGSAAHNTKALLDTIKANVGLDRLQQMRAASPTGGALGNVTERENTLLQSVLGSLEQTQSKDQFVYNLKRLNNVWLDIVHGVGQGPARLPLREGNGWQDMGGGVSIRRKE